MPRWRARRTGRWSSGTVTPRAALIYGVVLEVLAFGILWWGANLLAALLALAACLFYVFVYTLWLKRSSAQNIVIGGAAGAAPVLVGWAAVAGSLSLEAWIAFAIVFFWTPPHFWALAIRYADDYGAAAVPMLPSVASERSVLVQMTLHTVAVIALSLWFAVVADTGALYLVVAVSGWCSIRVAAASALALPEPWYRNARFPQLHRIPRPAVRGNGSRRDCAVPLVTGLRWGTGVQPVPQTAAIWTRTIWLRGPRVARVPRWCRPQAALPAESGNHFAA